MRNLPHKIKKGRLSVSYYRIIPRRKYDMILFYSLVSNETFDSVPKREWNVIFFSLLSRFPMRFGLIFALVKLREPLEGGRDLPVWFWCILQCSAGAFVVDEKLSPLECALVTCYIEHYTRRCGAFGVESTKYVNSCSAALFALSKFNCGNNEGTNNLIWRLAACYINRTCGCQLSATLHNFPCNVLLASFFAEHFN